MSESHNHLHNVFFTLKDSSPAQVQRLVEDCFTYLEPRPGVLEFSAGARAIDCTRPVNDVEFHVALTVLFTGRDAHDAYQASAEHDEFVARNKPNWARARVFDSDVAAT